MCQNVIRLILMCIQICVIAACCGCSKEPRNTNSPVSSGEAHLEQKIGTAGTSSMSDIAAETTLLSTVEHLRTEKQKGESHSPKFDIVFSEQGRGVAYIAEQNGRQYVVHNGKPGNFHSEISHLKISADGQRVSYGIKLGNYLQMVSDGIASRPYVDVYDAVYSPDSRHVAYLAEGLDKQMHIVLDGKSIGNYPEIVSSNFLFSSDSTKILYHVRPQGGNDANLVIFDLKTGSKTAKNCLDAAVIMNSATNRIAMVAKEGNKQLVIDFVVSAPDAVHKSALYDEVSNLSIGVDGKTVAFVGEKGKHRYLVLNGREGRIPDDLQVIDSPVIRPDLKGAGIILATKDRYNSRYFLHQALYSDGSKAKGYGNIKELDYNKVNNSHAYAAMEGEKCFVVLNGKEGPAFDVVIAPMFSPDGSKVVYRGREGEKRFVVVAETTGKKNRRHPEYDMVFPTAFTADGRSVAYGVKEGNQLVWKVEKL